MKSIILFIFSMIIFKSYCQSPQDSKINKLNQISQKHLDKLLIKGFPKEYLNDLGLQDANEIKDFKIAAIQHTFYINQKEGKKIGNISDIKNIELGYYVQYINTKNQVIQVLVDITENELTRSARSASLTAPGSMSLAQYIEFTGIGGSLPNCYDGVVFNSNYIVHNSNLAQWLRLLGDIPPPIYQTSVLLKTLSGNEYFFYELRPNIWVEQDELIKSYNSVPLQIPALLNNKDIVSIVNLRQN
jgi:hypothetical protein